MAPACHLFQSFFNCDECGTRTVTCTFVQEQKFTCSSVQVSWRPIGC